MTLTLLAASPQTTSRHVARPHGRVAHLVAGEPGLVSVDSAGQVATVTAEGVVATAPSAVGGVFAVALVGRRVWLGGDQGLAVADFETLAFEAVLTEPVAKVVADGDVQFVLLADGRLWRPDRGGFTATLPDGFKPRQPLPGGWLAAESQSEVLLVDVLGQRPTRTVNIDRAGPLHGLSLGVHPDGRLVITATTEEMCLYIHRTTWILDPLSGAEEPVPGQNHAIYGVAALLPGGVTAWIGHTAPEARQHNDHLWALGDTGVSVTAVAVFEGEPWSGDSQGHLRRWPLVAQGPKDVGAFVRGAPGPLMTYARRAQGLSVYDPETFGPVRTVGVGTAHEQVVSRRPGGLWVQAPSSSPGVDARLRRLDPEGAALTDVRPTLSNFNAAAVSPDGRLAAFAGRGPLPKGDPQVGLIDADTAKIRWVKGIGAYTTELVWSADSARLLVRELNQESLVDVKRAKIIGKPALLKHRGAVRFVGHRLAALREGRLTVLDETFAEAAVITAPEGLITKVLDDGAERLALTDGPTLLVIGPSGSSRAVALTGRPTSAALSPDRQRLAAGLDDGRLWVGGIDGVGESATVSPEALVDVVWIDEGRVGVIDGVGRMFVLAVG